MDSLLDVTRWFELLSMDRHRGNAMIRIGRERKRAASLSRCNYGRNTMECQWRSMLAAIRAGNLERYEISQAQRWYAAAMLTPATTPRGASVCQMDIGCLNLPRHRARRAPSIISHSGVKNSSLTCSFLRFFLRSADRDEY